MGVRADRVPSWPRGALCVKISGMLNKKKAQTWVKVVAWLLAISFALGMTLFAAIPILGPGNRPPQSGSSSGRPAPSPDTEADPADSLIGQGDLALKNGRLDEAVGFYEQAYTADKKKTEGKLAEAYFALGQKAEADKDEAKARAAYGKYLAVLPEGPKAAQVRSALDMMAGSGD